MSDLTNLLCGVGGALIGTYLGAYFINRDKQKYKENIRNTAIRALNLFKAYDDKTYQDAANEFNTKFNITEKRIILVALYKIGIPVVVDNAVGFSLENIKFMGVKIKEKEISDMKSQIESGNCDNLFFEDPEEYFNKNILNRYKRNIAIKFVEKVLKYSKIGKNNEGKDEILYPENWRESFSVGERDIALVFLVKLSDNFLYDKNTKSIKQEKIDAIINEINIGLWDSYLYWTPESFLNVLNQNSVANDIKDILPLMQKNALKQFKKQSKKR